MPNIKKIRTFSTEEEIKLITRLRESIAFKADLIRALCIEAFDFATTPIALDIISKYGAGFNAAHAAKAVEWFPVWFDDETLPQLHAKYEDYLILLAIASRPKEEAFTWYAKFEAKRKENVDWTPWEIYTEIQIANGRRERHDPAALKFDGKVTFRKTQVLIKPTTATGVVVKDNGEYHVKLIRKDK